VGSDSQSFQHLYYLDMDVRPQGSCSWTCGSGVWELKRDVRDPSFHQLPLNWTHGVYRCMGLATSNNHANSTRHFWSRWDTSGRAGWRPHTSNIRRGLRCWWRRAAPTIILLNNSHRLSSRWARASARLCANYLTRLPNGCAQVDVRNAHARQTPLIAGQTDVPEPTHGDRLTTPDDDVVQILCHQTGSESPSWP